MQTSLTHSFISMPASAASERHLGGHQNAHAILSLVEHRKCVLVCPVIADVDRHDVGGVTQVQRGEQMSQGMPLVPFHLETSRAR